MIRQVSAWGQFWFDLSSLHRVSGGAIFTPRCSDQIKRSYVQMNRVSQSWRKPYFSTWVVHTPRGAIYYSVEGNTMVQMLRDGLQKTGCLNLRMKIALFAVLLEEIEYRLERLLR